MEHNTNNIRIAFLVIGDEILSGRTKDKNIKVLIDVLAKHGQSLDEARIISDDHCGIVRNIKELIKRYDFVFSSGGIGPTHDDKTTAAIAEAFNTTLTLHQHTYQKMVEHCKKINKPLTKSRKKMAFIPKGATVITNPLSIAPGFYVNTIGSVFVLAGVPQIFSASLKNCLPFIPKGKVIYSKTLLSTVSEGDLAETLTKFTNEYSDIIVGSYPNFIKTSINSNSTIKVKIVLRHTDKSRLLEALKEWRKRYLALDKHII